MFDVIQARLFQKQRTLDYPCETPQFPELYRGVPRFNAAACVDGCRDCIDSCPVDAVSKREPQEITIDLGRCIFCGACENICKEEAISFSHEHRMAVSERDALLLNHRQMLRHAAALKEELLRLFGRSFRLRQVSAGGCNACEAEIAALDGIEFDIARFGISFVASPRHADGLLVTGPVTENMTAALLKAYETVPEPKVVIAVGACAISGGLFAEHAETHKGVAELIPVDLYIPGCPPHPLTILDGLLTAIKRDACCGKRRADDAQNPKL